MTFKNIDILLSACIKNEMKKATDNCRR